MGSIREGPCRIPEDKKVAEGPQKIEIVNKTTATLSVQQTHSHKSVSLPTTPVSKRKAVDDLLGLGKWF